MTRKSILLCLLLLPLGALAGQRCEHSQPRDLELDLAGVDTVVFEVGAHDLRLAGGAGKAGRLKGRACASDPVYFKQLTLTQHRKGDTLVVGLQREGLSNGFFKNVGQLRRHVFGQHYARLEIAGDLPARMKVEVKVGSGDARIDGIASLQASVGSGDLQAGTIAGPVRLNVGSGDATLRQVGSLQVASIGSGDVTATTVAGNARIGSIGSGDLVLGGVRGDVEIGSIGSGDAQVRDVTGSVRIGSIGSGDLVGRGIGGDLVVRSTGSGSVSHRDVGGRVTLPSRD